MSEKDCPLGDVIIPGPMVAENAQGILRHVPGEGWKRQIATAVEEGKPIVSGEIVQVKGRGDGTYEATTLYKHEGPARVATKAYRAGYDAIEWKKKEAN